MTDGMKRRGFMSAVALLLGAGWLPGKAQGSVTLKAPQSRLKTCLCGGGCGDGGGTTNSGLVLVQGAGCPLSE